MPAFAVPTIGAPHAALAQVLDHGCQQPPADPAILLRRVHRHRFQFDGPVLGGNCEHYSDGISVVPDERIQLAAVHVRANLFERFISK